MTTAKEYITSVWRNERGLLVLLLITLGVIVTFVGLCVYMSCCCSSRQQNKDVERGLTTMKSAIYATPPTYPAALQASARGAATRDFDPDNSNSDGVNQIESRRLNHAYPPPQIEDSPPAAHESNISCTCTITYGPCHLPYGILHDPPHIVSADQHTLPTPMWGAFNQNHFSTSPQSSPGMAPPSYEELMTFDPTRNTKTKNYR